MNAPTKLILSLLAVTLAAFFAASSMAEESESYENDLARKQVLLQAIMEKNLPSAGKAGLGVTPMCGAVTPEKNHEILKERED